MCAFIVLNDQPSLLPAPCATNFRFSTVAITTACAMCSHVSTGSSSRHYCLHHIQYDQVSAVCSGAFVLLVQAIDDSPLDGLRHLVLPLSLASEDGSQCAGWWDPVCRAGFFPSLHSPSAFRSGQGLFCSWHWSVPSSSHLSLVDFDQQF